MCPEALGRAQCVLAELKLKALEDLQGLRQKAMRSGFYHGPASEPLSSKGRDF